MALNQKKAEAEIEKKLMERFNFEMEAKVLEDQKKVPFNFLPCLHFTFFPQNQEKAQAEIEEKLVQKFQEQLQSELEAKVQEVESQKKKVF